MREGDVRARRDRRATSAPEDARAPAARLAARGRPRRRRATSCSALLQADDFSHAASSAAPAARTSAGCAARSSTRRRRRPTAGGEPPAAAARGLFDACVAGDPLRAGGRLPRPREGASSSRREGEPPRVALVADGDRRRCTASRTRSSEIRERGVPGLRGRGDRHRPRRRPPPAARSPRSTSPSTPASSVGVPSLPAVVEALAEGRYDLVHLCSPGPAGRRRAALVARVMELPVVGSYHTELAAYAGLRSGDPTLEAGVAARARAPSTASADVVLSPSAASDDVARRLGIARRADRPLGPRRRPRPLRARHRATEALLPGRAQRPLRRPPDARRRASTCSPTRSSRARARDPRLHLVLAGGGPEEARAARAPRRARDVPRLARRRRARRAPTPAPTSSCSPAGPTRSARSSSRRRPAACRSSRSTRAARRRSIEDGVTGLLRPADADALADARARRSRRVRLPRARLGARAAASRSRERTLGARARAPRRRLPRRARRAGDRGAERRVAWL